MFSSFVLPSALLRHASCEPLLARFAILDPPSSILGLCFGCGAAALWLCVNTHFCFAASAVNWRNSIFLAPLGGVKLNS